MAKKHRTRNRNSKERSKVWALVGAIVAIAFGILWNDKRQQETRHIQSCGLVMAESAIPNAGWGIFTLKPIQQGNALTYGEVVVQVPDVVVEQKADLHTLLEGYAWNADRAGGHLEGYAVYSAIPGVGALANGHPQLANVRSSKPQVSHGGVKRDTFPGAGAFSHYFNSIWRATQSLRPGNEIILDYGSLWNNKLSFGDHDVPTKRIKELTTTGICLDNIMPQQSTIVGAGRGAFASRFLAEGSVIAPVPLMPIKSRNALKRTSFFTNSTTKERQYVYGHQLLLNYCYGHVNSSLLFFPYSPTVNLINHDPKQANARVQWSQSRLHVGKEWLEWPLDKVKEMDRSGLLLELIATRDIESGEEILIDYGNEWQSAWDKHVEEWTPHEQFVKGYKYPSDLEQESELRMDYPINIQPACFYNAAERGAEVARGVGTIIWERTKRSVK